MGHHCNTSIAACKNADFPIKSLCRGIINSTLVPLQLLQKEIELKESDADEFDMDEYDDIFSSPLLDECLQHATLIATLAERFKLTSFKLFKGR